MKRILNAMQAFAAWLILLAARLVYQRVVVTLTKCRCGCGRTKLAAATLFPVASPRDLEAAAGHLGGLYVKLCRPDVRQDIEHEMATGSTGGMMPVPPLEDDQTPPPAEN